jgi:hypothetical protein
MSSPSGPWSPWALFGVIAAAVAVGGVLLWIVGMFGAGAMLGGFSFGASQRAETAERVAATRPVVTRRVVTVPAKGRDACLAESGGQVNEHYARCRRGYQYVETVTR